MHHVNILPAILYHLDLARKGGRTARKKSSRKDDPYGLGDIGDVSKTAIKAAVDVATIGMVSGVAVYGINAFSNLIDNQ
jgi:hypothetical protein